MPAKAKHHKIKVSKEETNSEMETRVGGEKCFLFHTDGRSSALMAQVSKEGCKRSGQDNGLQATNILRALQQKEKK